MTHYQKLLTSKYVTTRDDSRSDQMMFYCYDDVVTLNTKESAGEL